jgi:hypothetical protein
MARLTATVDHFDKTHLSFECFPTFISMNGDSLIHRVNMGKMSHTLSTCDAMFSVWIELHQMMSKAQY